MLGKSKKSTRKADAETTGPHVEIRVTSAGAQENHKKTMLRKYYKDLDKEVAALENSNPIKPDTDEK